MAEEGGLSKGATRAGLSPASLGRHMARLEQKIGQQLFERTASGYGLTPKGRSLLTRVKTMQACAVPILSEFSDQAETPVVRLSAGTGTTQFLIQNYHQLCCDQDDFRLNFVATEAVLDIAHRDADIGIRNQKPQAGNLASKPLGTVAFAPYLSRTAKRPDLLDWVGIESGKAIHPAARWVHDQGHKIRATAESVAAVHHLIRAGVGIGLVPCFVGDSDPLLTRAGDPIDALNEQQTLVVHNDDRHIPRVRRTLDRLTRLYAQKAALLSGRAPMA